MVEANLLESGHKVDSSEGVQTRGGLIQDQNRGVNDQFHANGHTTAFATRDSSDATGASHLGSPNMLQT